jgi:hypothetical protein
MNYGTLNLDLQSVVKRCYDNLLYRSSFMNFLNRAYIGDIRQTGTPTIEIAKQNATPTNKAIKTPDLTSALNPTLASYGSKLVDLTELRLDYSFRVSYLMTESGMKKAVDGQIELQDSTNATMIDEYGYDKFASSIVGSTDGSLAYNKGQVIVWNPANKDAYITLLNSLKAKLFNRKIYENYLLGLEAVEYGNLVSALTSILKFETMAGVEGVDRGDIARAYGISIFPINSDVLDSSNTKGYFANEVGTVGDAFFSRFNEFNGSYPGFPGYYVVEGVILFGAEVVRPEAIIKLVSTIPTMNESTGKGTFDNGTVGASYTQTTAFNGTNVATFEAVGLPEGLSLNKTTGAVTGTPTTAGTYSVNIYGIDSNGNYSNAQKGTITIATA